MNVQLINGQTYTEEKNGFTYDSCFGRIRNLNLAIISGEMADPESFTSTANATIFFYANKQAMIDGLQPLFTIGLEFNNADILSILDIDAILGYSVSEKKIYDYFLSLDEYSTKFEYVPTA